jgi:hypothetical protein
MYHWGPKKSPDVSFNTSWVCVALWFDLTSQVPRKEYEKFQVRRVITDFEAVLDVKQQELNPISLRYIVAS